MAKPIAIDSGAFLELWDALHVMRGRVSAICSSGNLTLYHIDYRTSALRAYMHPQREAITVFSAATTNLPAELEFVLELCDEVDSFSSTLSTTHIVARRMLRAPTERVREATHTILASLRLMASGA